MLLLISNLNLFAIIEAFKNSTMNFIHSWTLYYFSFVGMSAMLWGLSLWCFSPCFSLLSSVILMSFFFFFVTLGGYSHWGFFRPFPLGLHFIEAGHGVPSESLVQQLESKLFCVLFILCSFSFFSSLHFIQAGWWLLMYLVFLQLYIWLMLNISPRFFSTLPLSTSVGRTEFKFAFLVMLYRWLLLLPFCSVKQFVTSGDFYLLQVTGDSETLHPSFWNCLRLFSVNILIFPDV